MRSLWTIIVQLISDIIRITVTLTWPVSDYILDFVYHLFVGRTKTLPPIRDKILLMTVTELASKIRKRELSSQRVVKAFIERSKAVHPFTNAVTDERYEEALSEAREVDKLLQSTRKSEKEIEKDTPLLGVPFSCKESIGVKGLRITNGHMIWKNRIAGHDSDTAALYRKAGGIPIAVTNVPEMSMWWEAANQIFGRTVNPYDSARSVGGSTGGEGTIITSSASPMGIGNDIAGSIRIPASFCGIYGHKPSVGIISNKTGSPEDDHGEDERLEKFVSTGPMCRHAEDLLLLARVLADNHSNVQWDAKIDFRRVNFFYMEDLPGILLQSTPDVRKAVKKAVKHFEDEYGVQAVKLNIEEMKYAFPIWECKLLETGTPPFREILAPGKNLCWEWFKALLGLSDHTLPALYFAIVDRREKDAFYHKCLQAYQSLERKFDEILKGDSIFFLPTHREPPPHYLMTMPKYKNIGYTCIFSILGFPSTQIPAGLSKGLPIGIQAISRPNQDHLTIATAMELDKVFNGWINPGPVDL